MKVYLAASYAHKDRMKIYAAALREDGHVVTSEWIDSPHFDNGLPGVTQDTEQRDYEWAMKALQNIRESDVVFFFAEQPYSPYSRGGRHVEFGYALALNKPILSIGFRENIFHTIGNVFFKESFADAAALLNSILEKKRTESHTEGCKFHTCPHPAICQEDCMNPMLQEELFHA